jgi:hypothetical protein
MAIISTTTNKSHYLPIATIPMPRFSILVEVATEVQPV